jgi:hypothetical protein
MAVNRLRYKGFKDPDAGADVCERTFYIRQTLDRGLNQAGAFRFLIPADGSAFTDLNATYLKVKFRVIRSDGSKLDSTDAVFLGPGSLQALFSSCEVLVNGSTVSITNNYSYAGTLASYVGCSKVAREDIWSELSGGWTPQFPSSKITPSDSAFFVKPIQGVAMSREVTLTGRVLSDFLMSCSQLALPNMALEVVLNRAPDSFALCSVSEDTTRRYKMDFSSASLFVRRVRMGQATMTRTMQSISGGDGGMLRCNRLSSIVTQVPDGALSFSFNNVYSGGELPFSFYVMFVSQRAFSGSLSDLPNFFEPGSVTSMKFMESGREIQPEAVETKFVFLKDGYSLDTIQSDATMPFLSMYKLLDSIAQPNGNVGMAYQDFLRGCIFWTAQLNSCGGRKVAPGGFLDVQVTFDHEQHRPDPLHMICLGEFDRTVHFDSNMNIVSP